MAKDENTIEQVVRKIGDGVKDLPKLVKENKGATVGAVVGYLLGDVLKDNEGLVTAVVGGLVGKAVDDKKKENKTNAL